MRTSQSQFEMLVTFMEQNGDLCKLCTSKNSRARVTSIKKWEELAVLLNSDGAGVTKTTEKWKKVWGDLKNNTKKKASRLHRSAIGTGGGPAVYAKLSDLEQRVLNLIGVQVATGLAVEEAGLSQEITIPSGPHYEEEQGLQSLYQYEESSDNQPPLPSSHLRAISSPPLMFLEQEVQSSQRNLDEPGPSTSTIAPAHSPPEARPPTAASHLPIVEVLVEESGVLSPTRPSSHIRVVRPDPTPSVQTTPRRARRTRGSPRTRVRPAHTDNAAQHFIQADSFWRNFKEQQHQDNVELRREHNRIREMEIQVQRDWQVVGNRALNLIEKMVDKFCK